MKCDANVMSRQKRELQPDIWVASYLLKSQQN